MPPEFIDRATGLVIFHLDRKVIVGACRDFSVMKKDQHGRYSLLREYWGNIVIFTKIDRTDNAYAFLVDADGLKCHSLTRATFQRFKNLPQVRHIYVNRINDGEFNKARSLINKMSVVQLDEVRNIIERRQLQLTEDD